MPSLRQSKANQPPPTLSGPLPSKPVSHAEHQKRSPKRPLPQPFPRIQDTRISSSYIKPHHLPPVKTPSRRSLTSKIEEKHNTMQYPVSMQTDSPPSTPRKIKETTQLNHHQAPHPRSRPAIQDQKAAGRVRNVPHSADVVSMRDRCMILGGLVYGKLISAGKAEILISVCTEMQGMG